MILTELVAARLKAHLPVQPDPDNPIIPGRLTSIKSIKGAAELAAAKADQYRDTAFVLLADETASDNAIAVNYVRQQVTTGIAIVLAISNRRDRRGAQGLTEIEASRDEVRKVLLGWQPTEETSEMVYRRGRLLEMNDQVLWWQDEYELSRLISTEQEHEQK